MSKPASLEEAYHNNDDWTRMSIGETGAFVRKLPETKKGAEQGVTVEIRPVDENGQIIRTSSHTYVKTYEQFVQFADLIAVLRKSKSFEQKMRKIEEFNKRFVKEQEASKPIRETPVIQL